MHADIPQWMPQAYVRAVQAAGSEAPKEDLKDACRDLVKRWASPDRYYHNVLHLIDTVTNVETLAPELHEPDLVRLAAWYHGVVFSTSTAHIYRRNGGENEAASATFALRDLLRLGVPEKNAQRVAELVAGIRPKTSDNSKEPACDETSRIDLIDIDLQALRDAHMGTLSTKPQRYKTYIGLVRQEYSHIPLLDYLEARRIIMRKLLNRPVLFITPLARQWEAPARENLSAELQRIDAKIAAITSATCCTQDQHDEHISPIAQTQTSPATLEQATPVTNASSASVTNVSSAPVTNARTSPAMYAPGDKNSSTFTSSQSFQAENEEVVSRSDTKVAGAGALAKAGITPKAGGIAEEARSGKEASSSSAAHLEDKAGFSQADEAIFSNTSFECNGSNREEMLSTLESCSELFEPGEKIRSDLTPLQIKQLRRERLAQEVRRRIEERQSLKTRPSSQPSPISSASASDSLNSTEVPSEQTLSTRTQLQPAPLKTPEEPSSFIESSAETSSKDFSSGAPAKIEEEKKEKSTACAEEKKDSAQRIDSSCSGMEREPDL